jgi:hypothetical protein
MRKYGMRPYGFTNEGEPVPDEIDVLVGALRAHDSGESINEILRRFDEDGIRTSQGKPWRRPGLKRRLKDPRLRDLAGDPELWDRVVEQLARRSRAVVRGRRYLYTGGKARCGICGHPLQAQPNNNRQRGYACRKMPGTDACGSIRISADHLEAEANATVLAHAGSPVIRRQLAASAADLAAIPDRIASARRQLDELAEDYANGDISRDFAATASARVEHRIAELTAAGARGVLVTNVLEMSPEGLAGAFEDSSLEDQREIIDVFLEYVEVGRQTRVGYTGIDRDRLDFHFRKPTKV